jgi:opacity protein-like surface antigen
MTRWIGWSLCVVVGLVVGASGIKAQKVDGSGYGQRNTFGVMGEYSNDSSHIVLGESDNVKLGAVGVQYQRRLIANRRLVFSYAAEFRPAIVESNPTETTTLVQTFPTYFKEVFPAELTVKCVAGAVPYHFTQPDPPVQYSGASFTACGRETNYALGFAPFGMRLNFRPRSRIQPTLSTFEGMILSTKPLPVATAGSFNFAFEIGAGVEYYRTEYTSVRLEFQMQHYSNAYTAGSNPGVDNGIVKVTYSFGR